MSESAGHFVFATCQRGAENALKREVLGRWPDFRFSYSRPGFVTFRVPDTTPVRPDFNLHSVFARSWGTCLGRIEGSEGKELASRAWQMWGSSPPSHVHVIERDERMPGERGFEPSVTPLCREVAGLLRRDSAAPTQLQTNQAARNGELIGDCILVQPGEWWIGLHQASSPTTRYPGGNFQLRLPAYAVSRAYLKMEEAIRWSQLPLRAGDQCVELGSAPGGACQSLLDRRCHVLGIDPAEMHPDVMKHKNFTHLRMKAAETRRKDLRGVRWLMADSNVAPQHTLDSVEALVTHADVNIRGMLLTLKLTNWDLADELQTYLSRIRGWGFQHIRARQLAHNRMEICVAALRNRGMIRFGNKKSRAEHKRGSERQRTGKKTATED